MSLDNAERTAFDSGERTEDEQDEIMLSLAFSIARSLETIASAVSPGRYNSGREVDPALRIKSIDAP